MYRIVEPWSINTVKEFDGIFNNAVKTKYILIKNEKDRICELDIVELRKLAEFFQKWQDPFQIGNPKHSDTLK